MFFVGGKGDAEGEKRNAKNSKGNMTITSYISNIIVERFIGFGVSDCKFWKAPMEVMKPIWERVGEFMDETVEENDKKWALVKNNPLNEKFRYYCCTFHSFCWFFVLFCDFMHS